MTAKNQSKTVLTLAVILGVFAAVSGSLQARRLVYEPFDYPEGALDGPSGTTEVGLDGVWAAHSSGWLSRPSMSNLPPYAKLIGPNL